MKSFIKSIFFISILFILNFYTFHCKNLKSRGLSEEKEEKEEKEITIITSDDEQALKEATFYLWKLGGYIYIDTPVITIKEGSLSITGTLKGGIIGIKQSNGEYPRLQFIEGRKDSTIPYSHGVDVVGSNKRIQNIIIENAGSFGLFINGQQNTFDHVITRYNGESGIYISQGSDSNTFNYCYSYRNFLLPTNINADGFTIEVGANNNIFDNCFAWENSQNGFGYHYYNGKNKNGELTYSHSASWNNGNLDVFSGKYDFDNGKELDKNMWTIQEILKSDKEFEENYKNKTFDLKNAKINNIAALKSFINYNNEDDGNGFIFGNEKNDPTLTNRRIVDYCVSFDHKLKGFNNNKSQNFTGLFTNCVGFNNNMNYELPYSFAKWSNNWSWDSKEKDKLDGEVKVKKPDDIKSTNKEFYSVRDKIIDAVNANKFPDVNFDKVIKGLSE